MDFISFHLNIDIINTGIIEMKFMQNKYFGFILILISLITLFSPHFLIATEQTPDHLFYKGKKYNLRVGYYKTSLIQRYCNTNHTKNPFEPSGMNLYLSSGLNRGYIATWEIIDNKLYLIKIETEDMTDDLNLEHKEYDLKKLFKQKNKILADWVTDILFCDTSDITPAFTFIINKGVLTSKQRIIIPKLLH